MPNLIETNLGAGFLKRGQCKSVGLRCLFGFCVFRVGQVLGNGGCECLARLIRAFAFHLDPDRYSPERKNVG